MRDILISFLMLGMIVGVDLLGLEGSGVYQFVGLLRFDLDGVPIGGGVGGHVSLLAIVVGVVYAGGMMFTWEGKGSEVVGGNWGLKGRAAAGLAKVLGAAMMAVAAAVVLRYAWGLVGSVLR
ncbi:MAG: hypothetical protein OXO48_18070 [Caldilineaceae bacterium]|nr:hypothetical protein [Caldilineaceae bacterium]